MTNPQNISDLDIHSILLLDDNVELVSALKQLLEIRNYVVTTAKNGVEGLNEIMDMDFDVIICDMMMPTMPGDMFYLAVQRTKPHLCDRFIFMTQYGEDPKINDFIDNLKVPVLSKPVRIEELVTQISVVRKKTAA